MARSLGMAIARVIRYCAGVYPLYNVRFEGGCLRVVSPR
jgi:hypothetical protein